VPPKKAAPAKAAPPKAVEKAAPKKEVKKEEAPPKEEDSDYEAEYGSSESSDDEIVPPKNMQYVQKSNTVK
jgi:hypothetical protein